MTTDVNRDIIIDLINKVFYREVLKCILLGVFIIAGIGVSILVYKYNMLNSRMRSVLLVALICVCSLGLVLSEMMAFIPIYNDYATKSYTKEVNAEIFILEGTPYLLDNSHDVLLIREDGNDVKLKLDKKQYNTNSSYIGTIVYTQYSKRIIWCDILPQQ